MSDDDLSFMESEAPTTTALSEVMAVVNQLREQRRVIEQLEIQLADAKAVEDKLSGTVVPQMLDSNGVTSIKLDNDGEMVVVEVKEDVRASIPKDIDRHARGLAWLSEQGGGALIADVLTVEDPPDSLLAYMAENGVSYERNRDVNGNKLAAWFREKFGLKKNTVATMELTDVSPDVSVFRYRKTTIK